MQHRWRRRQLIAAACPPCPTLTAVCGTLLPAEAPSLLGTTELGGSETQLAREPSISSVLPFSGRPAAPSTAAAAGAVASSSGVMSRAPQKYLIQNQSGMKVFYWADGSKVR